MVRSVNICAEIFSRMASNSRNRENLEPKRYTVYILLGGTPLQQTSLVPSPCPQEVLAVTSKHVMTPNTIMLHTQVYLPVPNDHFAICTCCTELRDIVSNTRKHRDLTKNERED